MDVCLVRRGNEQWYCPMGQVEYWAAQGCTVYELTPTRVAGPDVEAADAAGAGPVTAEGSTGPTDIDESTTPVPTTGGSNE